MAKLSGTEFFAGIVLIAVGFFAAGAGLLQFPPTDTSVIVYSSGAGSGMTNAWPITTNWEPDRATNLTGISLLLKYATNGSAADYTLQYLVYCAGKPLGSGSGRVYVSGSKWAWYTIPTYEAAMGRVSGGFAKNAACAAEVSVVGGTVVNLWTPQEGAAGRNALTVWGYQASSSTPPPGPGPSGPASSGATYDAGGGDPEPTEPVIPPDTGMMAVTAIVILFIILGLVLLFLGLAGVFG